MIDHHGLCLGQPCTCHMTGPVPVVKKKRKHAAPVTVDLDATKTPAPAKHINLSQCLVLDNVAAGMNPYVVMSLTYMYRSTSQDAEPISVKLMGGGLHRIIDGRHRFVASLMAGRSTILAKVG